MITLVVCAVLGAVVGGFALFGTDTSALGLLRRARRQHIGDLPESTPGRIVGRVQLLGEPLIAPLSKRRCVLYIVRVEEGQDRMSMRASEWTTIIREEKSVAFAMADGTGRAIIDPANAQLALDFDHHGSSGMGDDPSEMEAELLAQHGESPQGSMFNRTLRYSEAVIGVDDEVAVLGAGVREPDPDAPPADAYRGDQPTRLRLTSSPRYPLVISDLPDALADKGG
jgi:hypothetical protein